MLLDKHRRGIPYKVEPKEVDAANWSPGWTKKPQWRKVLESNTSMTDLVRLKWNPNMQPEDYV